MMLDCQFSLKSFTDFFLNQIIYEVDGSLLRRAFEMISYCVKYLIPEVDVQPFKNEVYNVLKNWINQDIESADDIKKILVDNIFDF